MRQEVEEILEESAHEKLLRSQVLLAALRLGLRELRGKTAHEIYSIARLGIP